MSALYASVKSAKNPYGISTYRVMERAMGIEPTLFAWEARVLPLNDARGTGEIMSSANAPAVVPASTPFTRMPAIGRIRPQLRRPVGEAARVLGPAFHRIRR